MVYWLQTSGLAGLAGLAGLVGLVGLVGLQIFGRTQLDEKPLIPPNSQWSPSEPG